MQKTLYSLKRDIVEIGRRVYNRGYVASNDGNISARVDEKRILITPTGVSKGFMKTEDIALVKSDGTVSSGTKKPSSEVFMHLEIYKNRPDIHSVCHAHPPYATGFAVAGIPLDKCILPEVIIALGGIPLVEYGTPGTEEFYQPVLKILKNYDAFLLANHGALTIGKDIFNAYYKMETLEHFAHIAFVAQQLGHTTTLNVQQVQKLLDLRQKYNIGTPASCVSCEENANSSCELVQNESEQQQLKPGVVPCSGYREQNSEYLLNDKEALVKQVTEAILKQLH